MSELVFRPMCAGDAVLLSMQPSQFFEFGIEHRAFTIDEGRELADGGHAWTAIRGSRIVGIAGFREIWTGRAVAWATLSDHMAADHLACTRFAREQVAAAPYRRIEAVVQKDNPRAIAWAKLVGFTAVHELRGYCREGKPHLLFERVNV
jgi:hypothetical protein